MPIPSRPPRETPAFGLRVPGGADPPDHVTYIGNLADDVEAKLGTNWVGPTPPPPELTSPHTVWWDTSND